MNLPRSSPLGLKKHLCLKHWCLFHSRCHQYKQISPLYDVIAAIAKMLRKLATRNIFHSINTHTFHPNTHECGSLDKFHAEHGKYFRVCARERWKGEHWQIKYLWAQRVYRRGVFVFRRQIATTTTTTNALHNFVHIAVVTILLLPLLLGVASFVVYNSATTQYIHFSRKYSAARCSRTQITDRNNNTKRHLKNTTA